MFSLAPDKKKFIAAVLVTLALLAGAAFCILKHKTEPGSPINPQLIASDPQSRVLGQSAQGRDIESFQFGKGDTHIVFIGGMHGGYEWNSVLLAYEFLDYLKKNPEIVSEKLKVTVIPSANPDGVYKIIGKEGRFGFFDVPKGTKDEGRFNANGVDLNRNFDCNWQPASMWKNKQVSAGDMVFSEPESRAIRDFALESRPSAFIFWHSQANAVYASKCQGDVLSETTDIMTAYSKASGYAKFDTFDSYEITGDAGDWLASIGIAAITVELKTHETIEWKENLAGILAVFDYYNSKK